MGSKLIAKTITLIYYKLSKMINIISTQTALHLNRAINQFISSLFSQMNSAIELSRCARNFYENRILRSINLQCSKKILCYYKIFTNKALGLLINIPRSAS